ncbi:MAG: FimB/Mfa2 family fimbrial subunit, partial [Prevotella sp.]|nr:FimB/Mfa2 family fimbrial subunit [Prevotella sp.]
MKKSILSVILIASGLLSGCSSEESVSRPEIIGQTGTLTFSFPAPRRSVTYADGTPDDSGPLAATEDEAEINDVSIYMFEDETGGLLVAKKTASGDEITGRSVTFDVNDFITNGANYVFYAVANVSANITDDFVVGSTTLNYFTSAVATATGTDPNQGRNMLMAGFVSIGNLSAQTDPVQTINLRHRVARFDIDNLTADDDPANDNMEPGSGGNVAETFFEITKIHVKNTLSSGYLTEENNGQERPDPAAKVSLTGDDAIVVSGLDNINNGLVKSAFYLWPGEL